MVLVKNEEFWLPYTLKQCEGHFDSFVIYDVGSTDKTKEIIDWFYERNKDKADVFIRKLPHADPAIQGTFRNSMIAEGKRDIYFILDGDELYPKADLKLIKIAASEMIDIKDLYPEGKKRFGVFKRVEVREDLCFQYKERRTHHRLYTKDAFWTGTHPGEVSYYRQYDKSETHFPDITCWHMHNTLRSSKDGEAIKRIERKFQRTYHPGDAMERLDIIREIPMLAEPIEDFPVNPALALLQEAQNANAK